MRSLFGLIAFVFVVGLLTLIVFGLRVQAQRDNECHTKGGIPVHTDSGFICVRPEALIK